MSHASPLRIQQFADLAGVTVRTLRHYDRLGLLSPLHRTHSGYRLYRIEDLAQLERILVLRYLGLSLRQIADLLGETARPGQDPSRAQPALAETLAAQVSVLRERREGISRVLRAVESAQKAIGTGTHDWTLFQSILKEINMQEKTDWTQQYYSPEAKAAIDGGPQWTPELQASTTAHWNTLFADVESAMASRLDPSSPAAKALADRWMKLVSAFTQANPAVLAGLNKLYADKENWPAEAKQQNPVKPELMAWIRTVQAAHKPA